MFKTNYCTETVPENNSRVIKLKIYYSLKHSVTGQHLICSVHVIHELQNYKKKLKKNYKLTFNNTGLASETTGQVCQVNPRFVSIT